MKHGRFLCIDILDMNTVLYFLQQQWSACQTFAFHSNEVCKKTNRTTTFSTSQSHWCNHYVYYEHRSEYRARAKFANADVVINFFDCPSIRPVTKLYTGTKCIFRLDTWRTASMIDTTIIIFCSWIDCNVEASEKDSTCKKSGIDWRRLMMGLDSSEICVGGLHWCLQVANLWLHDSLLAQCQNHWRHDSNIFVAYKLCRSPVFVFSVSTCFIASCTT